MYLTGSLCGWSVAAHLLRRCRIEGAVRHFRCVGSPGASACAAQFRQNHSMDSSTIEQPRRTLRGVVFDMDGTLTVPCIDFAEMRRRVGVTQGDILDVIGSWPQQRQEEARRHIADIEEQALRDMKLMPGAAELCQYLDDRRIPRGLITRNLKQSVDYFHTTHFALEPFTPALGRECGWPYKPDPTALLHICETWGISPAEVMFIGDSAKDDVVCGNRAGAVTVLFDSRKLHTGDDSELQGELRPTFKVKVLSEVVGLLEKHFDLQAPAGGLSTPPGALA